MAPKIPGREDFREFLALFVGESDRAAVVLGGAYLDACLERTLRTWLADDVDLDEHFEPPRGFLSNYGAKYQLAHALGAISPEVRKQLLLIGSIRNHFGHHVLDAKWNHPRVEKKLKELRALMSGAALRLGARDEYLVYVSVLSESLRNSERQALARRRADAMIRAVKEWAEKRRK